MQKLCIAGEDALDDLHHCMSSQTRLRDVVCGVGYDGFHRSTRQKTGNISIAHHQICQDITVGVEVCLTMFQLHVSSYGVHGSLLNNLSRESGLASRIPGIFAPSFAAVMSIEAVQNLVHCGLKVTGPFESILTLRAADVPLGVSV